MRVKWAKRYGAAMLLRHLLAPIIVLSTLSAPALAQKGDTPYWAALRGNETNMRVGPGEDYKIAWVYRRAGLPLKVLRLKEGWRLVQDHEGTRGWMMSRFLTRARGAVVIGNGPAAMREQGKPGARLKWRLQPGVVGKLGDCSEGWCALDLGERDGFVPQDRLWGAGEP